MRPSVIRLVSRWTTPHSAFRHVPNLKRTDLSSRFGPHAQFNQQRSEHIFCSQIFSVRSFTSRQEAEEKDKPIAPFSNLITDRRLTALLHGLSRTADTLSFIYSRAAQTKYGRLMRLDKPIGTNLLFLPGAWGIAIAATSATDVLTLSALFYGGALLTRGAGCTINDIWDADIDKKVARTKSRPIASGEISTPAAFLFLGAQLFGGLGVLTQLNTECFLLGSAAVMPLLFYPFAKRYTAYPQAVLGLAMNWGALMGYCAASGTVGMPAVLLYGAGWCWTMVYDTIYAHQDKDDDARIGIGSAAVSFGERNKPALAALVAGKLALLTGAGLTAELSLPYFMGITVSGLHLARQVYATDLNDAEQCQAAFVKNEVTGAIVWMSILAGRLF